ncbi:MAG: transposase, partial [Bacteroidota bacterium]|nr:transposase [Bacteroidota bacterium]
PLVVVDPAEISTAQTCSVCHHIGRRRRKRFECGHCGNNMDADINASKNIAALGDAINHPENSTMYCTLNH